MALREDSLGSRARAAGGAIATLALLALLAAGCAGPSDDPTCDIEASEEIVDFFTQYGGSS